MNLFRLRYPVSSLLLLVALQNCSSPESKSEFYSAEDFNKVTKTDAHVHVQRSDSSFINQAEQDNFKLFTINYDDVNEPPPMEVQQNYAVQLINKYPQDIAYATTVSIRKFNENDWLSQ